MKAQTHETARSVKLPGQQPVLVIGKAIGRTIRYEQVSLDEYTTMLKS